MTKSPVAADDDNNTSSRHHDHNHVQNFSGKKEKRTQIQAVSSSAGSSRESSLLLSSSLPPSQARSRQSKNAGRWKILRDAILSASNDDTNTKELPPYSDKNASSIHRFEGYNLLKPTPLATKSPLSTDNRHPRQDGRVVGEDEDEDEKLAKKSGVSSKAMNGTNQSVETIMEKLLTRFEFEWDCNEKENDDSGTRHLIMLDRLEIAVLALAAYFSPKGKCMTVVVTTTLSRRNKNMDEEDQIAANLRAIDTATTPTPMSSFNDDLDWFTKLRQRLNGEEDYTNKCLSSATSSRPSQHPPVFVIKLDEKQEMTTTDVASDDGSGTTTTITTTTTTTQILVQESSNRKSTKYCVQRYDLSLIPSTEESNIPEATTRPSSSPSSSPSSLPSSLSLCTREPRAEKKVKLSLSDLVSHRYNQGVDNTGNICVWDSEKTLSYLLYHHWEDFQISNISSVINSSNDNDIDGQRFRILELGTGMAGLSGVALGLRLAATSNKLMVSTHPQSLASATAKHKKIIDVLLTDGNPTGVKNNMINQYLTSLYASAQQQLHRQNQQVAGNGQSNNLPSHSNGSQLLHPYSCLDVNCQKLLWTVDLPEHDTVSAISNYDVLLISDCTHFQNFHAALAVTTLRSLKVGGTAIFCQPSRGKSLENFCRMIEAPPKNSPEGNGDDSGPLISTRWFPQCHPILEEKHQEALRMHAGTDVYDESLHRPKIWIVTKLREITSDDQQRFISVQESRCNNLTSPSNANRN